MKKKNTGMRYIIHCITFIWSACSADILSRCWRMVI